MAEFVCVDMRPMIVVEGDGFKNLVKELDPHARVMSCNHFLERYILPMYNFTKDRVKAELQKSPLYAFTTDAWSSSSMQSYVTMKAHYPKSLELKSNVLDMHITIEGITTQNISR